MTIRADRALGGFLDKVLDDLVADVGLQQGQTHLAHTLADIGFGKAALTAQALEYAVQFFAKSLKCHGSLLLQGGGSVQDRLRQFL